MSAVAIARRSTRHFDEVDESAVVRLQGRDKFRVETFLVIVNQLETELYGEDLRISTISLMMLSGSLHSPHGQHTAQIDSLAHFRTRWISV